MDLNFISDPDLIPRLRDQIRILDVTLEPLADKRQVRVEVILTPFAPVDRPNLDITVSNSDGQTIASMSIIEAVQHRLAVTTHLREAEISGTNYTFRVDLYYDPDQHQHSLTRTVEIPLPGEAHPS